MLIVDVVSRFVHIATAIVLVGGTVFMRCVLAQAAAPMPESEHDQLRQRLLARWKRVVHVGITLLLITGFYNFMKQLSGHKGDGLYHGLVGTKILLALAMFFIASALVGRSAAFEKMRVHRKKWLSVLIVLATVVVGISSFVKVRGIPVPTPSKIESSEPK